MARLRLAAVLGYLRGLDVDWLDLAGLAAVCGVLWALDRLAGREWAVLILCGGVSGAWIWRERAAIKARNRTEG